MSSTPFSSRCGQRALLSFPPAVSVVAMLGVGVVTTTPALTAARPAVAPAFAATNSTTVAPAEVTALTPAATPFGRDCDELGVSIPRGKEAQRGGHNGSAGELYCLTARDCAGVQTPRQVVEGVNTSFISLHQQRNASFPFLQEQTRSTSKTGPPLC